MLILAVFTVSCIDLYEMPFPNSWTTEIIIMYLGLYVCIQRFWQLLGKVAN